MPKRAGELLKLEISVDLQNLQRRKGGAAPLSVEVATAADQTLTTLLDIAETYDADMSHIAEDQDLSDAGKQKARTKVATIALQKIADFENANVTRPRERAAELGRLILKKVEIQRPTDPAALAVYVAQMRTLWERLGTGDPVILNELADTSTDPLILDAIATCPPVWRPRDTAKDSPMTLMPIVDPAKLAAATLARAHAKDPETAARLEQIERLARCYEGSATMVKNVIKEQVSAAAEDPVAVQAAGR